MIALFGLNFFWPCLTKSFDWLSSGNKKGNTSLIHELSQSTSLPYHHVFFSRPQHNTPFQLFIYCLSLPPSSPEVGSCVCILSTATKTIARCNVIFHIFPPHSWLINASIQSFLTTRTSPRTSVDCCIVTVLFVFCMALFRFTPTGPQLCLKPKQRLNQRQHRHR